jgi:hypothetical protein
MPSHPSNAPLQTDTAAIQILSGLLSDGASQAATTFHRLQRSPKPALIPPPSQIALLTTLIIHPSFTTRAPETSNTHAASHALAYLRGLLATVGPINANFRAAFDFNTSHTSSSNGPIGSNTRANGRASNRNSRGASVAASSSSADDSSDDALTGPFARSPLIFGRGRAFWAVLGWAFRCAAEHPARWRHWRVWLELVVSVLEADWDERLARDHDAGKTGRGKTLRPYPLLGASLVVGYVEGLRRERKNAVREVMRGVFAVSDGENGVSDRALFKEVFEREGAAGKGVKSKRKRGEEVAAVDLENGEFGGYLDGGEFESAEEGEEGGEGPTPSAPRGGRRKPGRKPGGKPKGEGTAPFTLTDGIAETVPFRLRIFRLLSAVSYYLPETFAPVDEIYERFTDHVRALPLPMFRLFVESHHRALPKEVQVTYLRMLIEEMLPRHPDPADVDPEGGAGFDVTMRVMQECFLPFAANTVTAEDNAKLSLALESMMWFVFSHIDVEYSPGLRRAVERGIKAREDKIKRRPGAVSAAEKAAREMLARSARNLRALVDVIAAAEG